MFVRTFFIIKCYLIHFYDYTKCNSFIWRIPFLSLKWTKNSSVVCKICQKLHQLQPKDTKTYPDLEDWLFKNPATGRETCLSAGKPGQVPWSQYHEDTTNASLLFTLVGAYVFLSALTCSAIYARAALSGSSVSWRGLLAYFRYFATGQVCLGISMAVLNFRPFREWVSSLSCRKYLVDID